MAFWAGWPTGCEVPLTGMSSEECEAGRKRDASRRFPAAGSPTARPGLTRSSARNRRSARPSPALLSAQAASNDSRRAGRCRPGWDASSSAHDSSAPACAGPPPAPTHHRAPQLVLNFSASTGTNRPSPKCASAPTGRGSTTGYAALRSQWLAGHSADLLGAVESVSVEVVVTCRCTDGGVDLQERLSKRFRLVHVSNVHFADPGPRVVIGRPELRILKQLLA